MADDTVNKMARKKKDERTSQIRLPHSFVIKIRHLADMDGMDPGDWIVQEFGELIAKKYAKLSDRMTEGRREEKHTPPTR
jgi:hypothetical protein